MIPFSNNETQGRCATFFAAIVLMMSVEHVFAGDVIVVSNLDEPFRANSPIGNPEFWCAQSFLPSGTSYQLTSIEAIVGNGADSPQIFAELRRADFNGQIDLSESGLLATMTAPDMSGPTSVRSFLPEHPVSLVATEAYWFVLGSLNGGTYDWSYADTNNFDGPGLLGSFADSSNGGLSWTYGIKFPYFLGVNATVAELLGDVNCDGTVNLLDVSPFVDLLTSGGFSIKADINQDGVVNLLDVSPFVALLTGT